MTSRASLLPLRIEPLGDEAAVLVYGEAMDDAVNRRAVAAAERLAARHWPWVTDVVPSFAAVTVHYKPPEVERAPHETPAEAVRRQLQAALEHDAAPAGASGKGAGQGPRKRQGKAPDTDSLFDIPVCYGGSMGPDLDEAARRCGMAPEELVALHTGAEQTPRVFMLGFLPGAPYIGPLDARLAVPRRGTPRLRVPAGSVGLANCQSMVYTQEAPGGWSLIGRTPLALFDAARDAPALLQAGMRVRFRAISAEEFAEWPAP